jgi:predicted nucleic acid-binding protein
MTAFFDTCIVIALLSPAEKFHSWSSEQLLHFKSEGPILISDVVYAELAAAMPSHNDLDNALDPFGFERTTRNDAALFAAGKAFKVYKDVNKGPKANVLADFFIGALATELDVPLVTSNPKDFKKYFSHLNIVEPPNS